MTALLIPRRTHGEQIEVGFSSLLLFTRCQRSECRRLRLQSSAPRVRQETFLARQTAEINSFCTVLGPKANRGAELM